MLEIPQKDCKTYQEAEEYLNSLGIYIWHKNDNPEYIKYLLNIGAYVYVIMITTKSTHYYLLYKAKKGDFLTAPIYMFTINNITERPYKTMKFLRKGFTNYVYYLGVYF